MGADDDLRRELLQTALRDPAALERALQLAEHAYGWLGDPGSEAGAGLVETLALPAPARSGAVPDPAPPQRQRRPRRAKQAAPAEGGEAARAGSTWTEAEEDTLRQLYPGGAPQEDILAALPGRSWGTIGVRASKLGLHRPRGGAVAEELPIVATARKAAGWLADQGIAEIEADEYGIFWRHDGREDAEQLTPRQVIRLADSERGSRKLPAFGDGADLVGGPHQSSLGGVI
ncbi:MAG: hypothetical protein RIB84_22440 [Sneathiellaceae bacterium]